MPFCSASPAHSYAPISSRWRAFAPIRRMPAFGVAIVATNATPDTLEHIPSTRARSDVQTIAKPSQSLVPSNSHLREAHANKLTAANRTFSEFSSAEPSPRSIMKPASDVTLFCRDC